MRNPIRLIKSIMPRSLFGRSLIILVTPLILVQVVLGYIFFDRHTETILRLLSNTISGDIHMVVEMVEDGQDFSRVAELAHHSLMLDLKLKQGEKLPRAGIYKSTWLYGFMEEALRDKLKQPYFLRMSQDNIYLDVEVRQGVLHFETPRKRLFSRTTPLVLIWTTASALLLFIVASLFMRNQIRPLRRLGDAAERFGKGQDVGDYRPEGATEVRKAGISFNIMRDRIRRQLNERTEMLAGVSHDLRTPLARMKLQLAMMPRDPEVVNLTEDVEQMQKMLEGYLDFARGAGDESPISIILCDLFHDLKAQFRNTSLNITIDCPVELKIQVKAQMLKRCLMNLLVNSERYADHVWIGAQASGRFLEITIDDNGPGIPESQRDEVFRPFYRLDVSRNLETGGVGLGLSIARDVIRNHGGQIRLGDSPHGGLRVLIRLPQ
ncbi:MAG: HAMP domain-containing protein [Alphaproteobacteria bacterium]|jgi:two-component system osmolarity sensor histidine kinase EnvZ|nr:HAMP domain-containing protein [Alphaproteobacteria bacterium]